MATVEEFARITERHRARADLEAIALEWAANGAVGDEEFLVAFKTAPTQFKVIRRHRGTHEEAVFDVRDPGA